MPFEDKADAAGKALKESLGLESKEVQVDGQGKEAQLPPEGSYARAAIEAEAENQPAPTSAPPVEEVPEQPAAPEPAPLPPLEEESAVSKRARERIEELARRRREEEQARIDAEARAERLEQQLEKERAARQTTESDYQRFLNEQIENMDPEDRAQVLQEARIRDMLAEQKRELLQQVAGPLNEMRERELNRELVLLAQKYPGYDHDVHSDQVRDFMKRNPSTTPEQAFKAIADDDVLFIRPYGQQTSEGAPQFIQPKGTQGTENYVPAPQKDPDEELREKTREVHKLARISDPDAQREHRKELDALIKERLFGGKG
jgi:hypothetical protein